MQTISIPRQDQTEVLPNFGKSRIRDFFFRKRKASYNKNHRSTILYFMMRFLIALFILSASSSILSAQQYFTGIASKWSDELTEWNIYTYPEVLEGEEEPDLEELEATGELKIRWQNRGDWNSWDYSVGEESGYVRTLFTDDPGKWELMGNQNEVITFRQIWANDNREWRITDNKIQLTFKTRYGNRMDEWIVRGESHGYFRMHTTWEGDPRDWVIIDEMDETISSSMKMALIFIATFVASSR